MDHSARSTVLLTRNLLFGEAFHVEKKVPANFRIFTGRTPRACDALRPTCGESVRRVWILPR